MTDVGKFIVIEGVNGSGKSSVAKEVWSRIECDLLIMEPVMLTREPGGSIVSERIRRVLKESENMDETARFLLNQASRVENYNCIIGPSLAMGTHVISDRFTTSSLVYHGVNGVDHALMLNVIKQTMPGDYMPDLEIYLDVSYETAINRVYERGDDRISNKFRPLNPKLVDSYASYYSDTSIDNVYKVDAEQDFDTVCNIVEGLIKDEIYKGGFQYEW